MMLRKALSAGIVVGAISTMILAGPTAGAARTGCVATVNRSCSWKATQTGTIEIAAAGIWRVVVSRAGQYSYVATQGTGAVSTLWPYIVKGDRIEVEATVAVAQQVGRV